MTSSLTRLTTTEIPPVDKVFEVKYLDDTVKRVVLEEDYQELEKQIRVLQLALKQELSGSPYD